MLKIVLRKIKKSLNENDLQLIYLLVKKDALGIPERPKSWYHFLERARGESILIPTNNIQEINCKRVSEVGKGCIEKIKAFLSSPNVKIYFKFIQKSHELEKNLIYFQYCISSIILYIRKKISIKINFIFIVTSDSAI